jgi:hypothetical protein
VQIGSIVRDLLVAAIMASALHCGGNDCLPNGNYTLRYTRTTGSDIQCPDIPGALVMLGPDAGTTSSSCQMGCDDCSAPAPNTCSGTFSHSCPATNQAGNYSCTYSAVGNSGSGSCSLQFTGMNGTVTCSYNFSVTKLMM